MKNNKGFVLRKIYDQFLLFPVRANEVGDELISINEVGADIWVLASEGRPEKDIIARIEEMYSVDFGAFVDIGVHQDGLVHVSEIADRFIKHPSEALSVGDVVQVRIKGVDLQKKRISLSMKGI